MKTKFGIKNFRVFDEEGVIFNMSPITILTGANSAGKSSLAKACLLLESFLKQISDDIERCTLDFTSYPLNTLARYDKTVHRGAKSTDIVFSYTVHSVYYFNDIDVTLRFKRDDSDTLNRGLLQTLTISDKDMILYSWERNDFTQNFSRPNVLRQSFIDFLYCESEMQKMVEITRQQQIDQIENSFGDYSSDIKEFNEFANRCPQKIFWSVAFHISSKAGKRTFFGKELKKEDIQWSSEHNSFFRFPILDFIDKLNVEDAKTSLLELTKKVSYIKNQETEDRNKLVDSINFLMDNFTTSDCKTFIEYYTSLEKLFFDTIDFNKINHSIYPFHLTFDVQINRNAFLSDGFEYFSLYSPWQPLIQISNKKVNDIDFIYVYELISVLDYTYKNDSTSIYKWEDDLDSSTHPVHRIYEVFKQYFTHFVYDALHPDWNLSYIGSSRVDVKKIYSFESNEPFALLLLEYFDVSRAKDKRVIKLGEVEKKYVPNSFINKWLEKFNVGKELIFKTDDNGLGVQLYIKREKNEEETLLAYEGYGITQLISLLLHIEVVILKGKAAFGNPIGLKFFDKFHYENRTIIIEEPEIHLHPRYQSLLAEMFYEAYVEYGIHFIIETHSEYLIRKTQAMVAHMEFNTNEECEQKCPFQTIYISKDKEPYSLGYRKDGKFREDFGPGFFDEVNNLLLEIY